MIIEWMQRLFVMVLLWAVMSAKSAPSPSHRSDPKPVVVQVAQVKKHPMAIYIDALGSLSALNHVTISSQTDARVAQIFFKDGQKVGRNMPILKLDSNKVHADYESAVTALNLSRRKYERAKLLPKGTLSEQELETLKAKLESNDALVKSDLALLNQKTISAPFSGVLGAFSIQPGDYVKAGDRIVDLVETRQLIVHFHVSQSLLPQLKLGQLVRLTVNAYPKDTFFGTVRFISPTVDQTTRSVSIQALVENKKGLLAPGMFCYVRQQIGEDKQALSIPEEAVLADIKGYYVYRVAAHLVHKTYITIGTRLNRLVQIKKGLKAGQVVVIAGLQKLQEGSLVTITAHDSGA